MFPFPQVGVMLVFPGLTDTSSSICFCFPLVIFIKPFLPDTYSKMILRLCVVV